MLPIVSIICCNGVSRKHMPILWIRCRLFSMIIHGLLGLVRSPVSATLPQISSRLYVTCGILWSFPEVRTHVLVSSLVISWSLTEIIRYSFFGMKEAFGSAPSWLLWLSTFLFLYPSGITSEVGLIYNALPYIKESEKYCLRRPNAWNFSFDYYYAALAVLGVYVPVLICTPICLVRGRKLSPNPKGNRSMSRILFSSAVHLRRPLTSIQIAWFDRKLKNTYDHLRFSRPNTYLSPTCTIVWWFIMAAYLLCHTLHHPLCHKRSFTSPLLSVYADMSVTCKVLVTVNGGLCRMLTCWST